MMIVFFSSFFSSEYSSIAVTLKLWPGIKKFMTMSSLEKFMFSFPSISCGQITNPTRKFPIKVIKHKLNGRIKFDILCSILWTFQITTAHYIKYLVKVSENLFYLDLSEYFIIFDLLKYLKTETEFNGRENVYFIFFFHF